MAGKSERKSIFKREDISTLAEIAEEQGVIKEKDSDFIKNIVKLQNVKLREIMTPSSVIKSADMDSTIEDFYSKNKKLPFSRIPIYANNKEEINYYVLKDTILEYVIQKNGKKKLSDIKRPIIKIGYESKITTLFDKLLKKREHISLDYYFSYVNALILLRLNVFYFLDCYKEEIQDLETHHKVH